jgi:hypothetical protein
MENTQNTGNQSSLSGSQMVPYSSSVLVLGILSIALCWCYGIVGIVLGIIALVQSSRGNKAYLDSPSSYKEGSYKNLKAGKICAIIGLCLSSLYVLYIIFILAIMGAALTSMPWEQLLHK